ncbi:MAG: nucleotidyltransferase family protein [Pseudomonadota bacterium]
MNHLRFVDTSPDKQLEALEAILRADPLVWQALQIAREMALPDWLIVSGAIYNSVWNHLTGREPGYGIKDIDLFYFDDRDLSYEAENAVIRRGDVAFGGHPLPVEIRNQARVHLWYRQKFGRDCPVYSNSREPLKRFASKTHAVGVRLLPDDRLLIEAPFGLADIFAFRVTPNHAMVNRETHEEKGARAKRNWPEVDIVAW